jgi:hypothetical protein
VKGAISDKRTLQFSSDLNNDPSMSRTLDSTADVIAALGGSGAVARRFGMASSRVCNWQGSSRFPASTYCAFVTLLAEIGKEAPASLWGMVQLADVASARPPCSISSDREDASLAAIPTAREW